jgi:hypothetical protein
MKAFGARADNTEKGSTFYLMELRERGNGIMEEESN